MSNFWQGVGWAGAHKDNVSPSSKFYMKDRVANFEIALWISTLDFGPVAVLGDLGCTFHSSSSVHTLDPEAMISSLVKNVREGLVATTSTFTFSYYSNIMSLLHPIGRTVRRTPSSSFTINGAFTDATLPVVIRRTCVKFGFRSASETKAIHAYLSQWQRVRYPKWCDRLSQVVWQPLLGHRYPYIERLAMIRLLPPLSHLLFFCVFFFRAVWAIFAYIFGTQSLTYNSTGSWSSVPVTFILTDSPITWFSVQKMQIFAVVAALVSVVYAERFTVTVGDNGGLTYSPESLVPLFSLIRSVDLDLFLPSSVIAKVGDTVAFRLWV